MGEDWKDAGSGDVWLVRHGETEWSRAFRHTSTTDVALTPEGEAAALGLRDRLAGVPFALVLTSPRSRARRTAELAGFAQAQVDEDLAEWGYGDYEGLTTRQIREQVPDWTIWTHSAPGGEAPEHVATRLDRVVSRARAVAGPVLLFGHAHSLRALAARWIGQPPQAGAWLRLDTASVSRLGHERETPVVVRWNA